MGSRKEGTSRTKPIQFRRFSCIMSTSEARDWKLMLFFKLNHGTHSEYLPSLLWRAAEGSGVVLWCSPSPVVAVNLCQSLIDMVTVCPRFGRGVFNSMLIRQKYFHLTDNLNDRIKAAITIRTNPALIDSHVCSQTLTLN